MFYTDTNGKVPEKRQFLLVLLESAMETMPLHEINIANFNKLIKDLNSLIPDFSNKDFSNKYGYSCRQKKALRIGYG